MYRTGPAAPHERFIDQFEPDGGDWLYRHKEVGAAYRVSDAEKDAFVAAFDKRGQRWFMRLAFAIYLLVFIGLFVVPLFDTPLGRFYPERLPPYLVPSILLFSFGLNWINDVVALGDPLKTLRLRVPVAPASSAQERQRITLARLEDTVLIGTIIVTFLLLLYFGLEQPPVGWIGWTLIVASVAGLIWAVVQGTRKWMLTRADYAANNLI